MDYTIKQKQDRIEIIKGSDGRGTKTIKIIGGVYIVAVTIYLALLFFNILDPIFLLEELSENYTFVINAVLLLTPLLLTSSLFLVYRYYMSRKKTKQETDKMEQETVYNIWWYGNVIVLIAMIIFFFLVTFGVILSEVGDNIIGRMGIGMAFFMIYAVLMFFRMKRESVPNDRPFPNIRMIIKP